MDERTFDKAFHDWLTMKPSKRKEWAEQRPIYYKIFGKESEAALINALADLMEKPSQNFFPSPPEIKTQLYANASRNTEQPSNRQSTDSEMVASRLLDHKLGKKLYDETGEAKDSPRPPMVQPWIEDLVNFVIENIDDRAQQGTLGLMVIRKEAGLPVGFGF
mgnify:CR=1 FL=1